MTMVYKVHNVIAAVNIAAIFTLTKVAWCFTLTKVAWCNWTAERLDKRSQCRVILT